MALISSSQVSTLDTRISFASAREGMVAKIREHADILFLPCAVADSDIRVRGNAVYCPTMYGTLINGEKAEVRLMGVPLYFDYDVSVYNPAEWRLVREMYEDEPVRANAEKEGIAKMRAILDSAHLAFDITRIESVWRFPMHGFTLAKHLFARIHFISLYARSSCIMRLRDTTDTTLMLANPNLLAHDDNGFNGLPSYFNAIAREYLFATGGWNIMRGGAYTHDIIQLGDNAGNVHKFCVELGGFVCAPDATIEDEKRARLYDRTMIESWDIETEFESASGEIPRPGDKFAITTISLVYSYVWREIPLICYVLSLYPTDAPNAEDFAHLNGARSSAETMRTIFIKCKDERDMILTRAKIAQRMQPDIRVAFNGANFDWALYNAKVSEYGLAHEIMRCMDLREIDSPVARSAERWSHKFTSQRVKVGAGMTHELAVVAIMAGTLDLDLMPVMRKIYKKEEVRFAQSLNKYLEKAKLPPKNDIYFKVMMRMLVRARELSRVPGGVKCHCADAEARAKCAMCKSRVRELDFAVANQSAPMHEWVYRDGSDCELRDPRLNLCCACGARVISMGDIARINTYCAIDSVRPLQLMRKLNVLGDARELASVTFTSLWDSFMRADGLRVVNFVGSVASSMGLNTSARVAKRERSHFQGAHVFNPMLGRYERPVTALDFNSLYPNIMRTYNISPDMLVTSAEYAQMLQKRGYSLHHIGPIECEDGEKVGERGNRKYTIEGWSVRHNGIIENSAKARESARIVSYDANNEAHYGRGALEREHMSLFGTALRILLDGRRDVRAIMGTIEHDIKDIMLRIRAPGVVDDLQLDMRGLEIQMNAIVDKSVDHSADCAKIMDMYLQYNCLNSKQLALKVLSNTFYGQMGSNMSSCYTLLGAAGVTEAGRINITAVAQLLRERGYTIVYGDTDSVYTCAPEKIYAAIDEEWRRYGADGDGTMSLEDYWGALVVCARDDIEKLRSVVSAYLRADNGTRFLNMGYEEVGLPSLFFGKKKYILRPHDKGVTFSASPMVRGLETVKQGHAAILRRIGNEIIEELLATRRGINVVDVIQRKIMTFYEARDAGKLDVRDFIEYKSYHPDRKNVRVSTFVNRMREKYEQKLRDEGEAVATHYRPPEPGDKFPCVVVECDDSVTLDGHLIHANIGAKTEYPWAVERDGARIDIAHYMDGALMSLFERFISCDAQFDPGMIAGENYKSYDARRMSVAKEYLTKYCAQFASLRVGAISVKARVQKSVASALSSAVSETFRDKLGLALDRRVAHFLINDEIRQICLARDDVSEEELTSRACDIICSIMCERNEAEIAEEHERATLYADALMHSNDARKLAFRYSRANFEAVILKPLIAKRVNLRGYLTTMLLPEFISIYRTVRADQIIASVTDEAVISGLRGKSKFLPILIEKVRENHAFGDILLRMSQYLRGFAQNEEEIRKETVMQQNFAQLGRAK